MVMIIIQIKLRLKSYENPKKRTPRLIMVFFWVIKSLKEEILPLTLIDVTHKVNFSCFWRQKEGLKKSKKM